MIRVLVIGAGRIAISHLPHLLVHQEISVIGIVEPSFLSRQAIKLLSRSPVYDDLQSVPIDTYDVAMILTPPQTHFELASILLEAGKHVFIEKPLTLAYEDSLCLEQMALDAGAILFIGYVYRAHPIFSALRKTIQGEVSEDRHFAAKVEMRGNVIGKVAEGSWRSSGPGAGCVHDYGCHAINLAFFLFGKPLEIGSVDTSELFREGVIDAFKLLLIYPGGSMVEIYCNWADPQARKAGIEVSLEAGKKRIYATDQLIQISGASEIRDVVSVRDLDTAVDYYLRGEDFPRQLDQFVSFVNEGPSPESHQALRDAVVTDEYVEKVELAV